MLFCRDSRCDNTVCQYLVTSLELRASTIFIPNGPLRSKHNLPFDLSRQASAIRSSVLIWLHRSNLQGEQLTTYLPFSHVFPPTPHPSSPGILPQSSESRSFPITFFIRQYSSLCQYTLRSNSLRHLFIDLMRSLISRILQFAFTFSSWVISTSLDDRPSGVSKCTVGIRERLLLALLLRCWIDGKVFGGLIGPASSSILEY